MVRAEILDGCIVGSHKSLTIRGVFFKIYGESRDCLHQKFWMLFTCILGSHKSVTIRWVKIYGNSRSFGWLYYGRSQKCHNKIYGELTLYCDCLFSYHTI